MEINLCEMVSRAGKATTQFYLPISNAMKEQERRQMGLDAKTGHDHRMQEVMPGLRALRQKRAMMMNQP